MFDRVLKTSLDPVFKKVVVFPMNLGLTKNTIFFLFSSVLIMEKERAIKYRQYDVGINSYGGFLFVKIHKQIQIYSQKLREKIHQADFRCFSGESQNIARNIIWWVIVLEIAVTLCLLKEIANFFFLIHFSSVLHLCKSWKRRKTFGFLTFSGSIKMVPLG